MSPHHRTHLVQVSSSITTHTVSISSTSAMAFTAGGTMTLTGPDGVDVMQSFVSGWLSGSGTVGTVTDNEITLNTMVGDITSQSTTLAAGSTDTVTLKNSYLTDRSLIFITVQSPCTTGYVVVVQAVATGGSATITIYNAGASACSTSYKLHFLVIRET